MALFLPGTINERRIRVTGKQAKVVCPISVMFVKVSPKEANSGVTRKR